MSLVAVLCLSWVLNVCPLVVSHTDITYRDHGMYGIISRKPYFFEEGEFAIVMGKTSRHPSQRDVSDVYTYQDRDVILPLDFRSWIGGWKLEPSPAQNTTTF